MTTKKFQEVADLQHEQLVQFFEERGIVAEVTVWKYFDREFNNGKPRGFAAVENGHVVGFIGLIPFQANVGGEVISTAWTCDWHIDTSRAKSMLGIALLRHASGQFGRIFHTGGNETTQHVFGRLAKKSDSRGVLSYRLRLRVGNLIRRAESRIQKLELLPTRVVSKIPTRRISKFKLQVPVIVEEGVTRQFLDAMVGHKYELEYFPVYDEKYLQWIIGRDPRIESWTIASESGVAALVWRSNNPYSAWRMELRWLPGATSDIKDVAESAIAFAYRNGADAIEMRVSRKDEQSRKLLEDIGFVETGTQPFYAFCAGSEHLPESGMTGLGFLDVDEAGLFY